MDRAKEIGEGTLRFDRHRSSRAIVSFGSATTTSSERVQRGVQSTSGNVRRWETTRESLSIDRRSSSPVVDVVCRRWCCFCPFLPVDISRSDSSDRCFGSRRWSNSESVNTEDEESTARRDPCDGRRLYKLHTSKHRNECPMLDQNRLNNSTHSFSSSEWTFGQVDIHLSLSLPPSPFSSNQIIYDTAMREREILVVRRRRRRRKKEEYWSLVKMPETIVKREAP